MFCLRLFSAVTQIHYHILNTTLLSNWHFMRILRALIAVWSIFEYTHTSDPMLLALGGILGFQAIFNVGCCGAAGCATTPSAPRQELTAQEVEYEEVK